MKRRHPAPLAVAAALLLLAARPSPILAAASPATYRLTNTSSQPVSEVVATVVPPGTIVPANPQTSPLSVLPGSQGFDQSSLKVLLGDGKTQAGGPLQALALDFGKSGLAPGGVLNFGLTLDPNFQGTLQITPQTPAAGVAIATVPPVVATPQTTPAPVSQGPPPVQQNTPEPSTVLLWSSLAGLGLYRARRRPRAA